jgi:hypothetical protein
LPNWHYIRKDLISRRSDRGAPVTPATFDFPVSFLPGKGRKRAGF